LRKVAKIVEIPINAFRANAGPGTQIAMPAVPGATCIRGVGIGLATDRAFLLLEAKYVPGQADLC